MKMQLNKKDIAKEKPSLRKRLFAWAINIIMIGVAAAALYVTVIFLQMPSLDSILSETRAPTIIFLDNSGAEIRATNRVMGTPVSVHSVPPHVWQSIIAIEDKRFFEHGAVDFRGLTRAIFSNIFHGGTQGGSSISQQTAKNIFLTRDKKISRKVQELILAQWLENRFDKNQILGLYMNRVSLVGGMRGIDAAARVLFNTTADKLTIAQSAQIAAMLKAPTTYSPRAHSDANIARAKIVLTEMVRQKYITLDAARTAAAQLRPAISSGSDTNIYRYWTDFVTSEITARIGNVATDIRVWTTLDSDFQTSAATAVAKNSDKYQGAAVAIGDDGAILAMVGGRDYQASQFNRAEAKRQPGSAFKATVYLVALENGMTPETFVNDSPFAIGDYNPKNYNEKYYGDITLADAFAKSVNSVPLKLTEQFGIDSVLTMAARLGVGSKLRREYSTILGASEMTLLDLTTMYDVIWNGGVSVRPYSITRITDMSGNVLYEHNPSDAMQILTSDTVYYMQQLLGDVTRPGGTGARANKYGVRGGKTGTSDDNRDAWFIGRAADTTIGVWMGNDDFTPMDSKITGGTLPAQIFKDMVMD